MKKSNHKIRNATVTKSNDITFKSQLEKMIYHTLLQNGITPEYEPKTFTLWPGFIPKTPFYDKETDKQYEDRNEKGPKLLVPKMDKIVGIRYTPDFYFKYNDIDVWIEAKGIENDVFYIKKKLFRKYLDNVLEVEDKKSMFFEVYSKRHVLQVLNILKNGTDTDPKD